MKDWKWYGNPVHLCVSSKCRFHLTTEVGAYVVATIGEYFPAGKDEMEEIGIGRKYETMVFLINGRCECGCGLPEIELGEKDSRFYNDAKAATEGHMDLCYTWATGRELPGD